ncbi:MAG: hypothetical protein K2Z81_06870 [Cyanobacteria bacterium]|nr:hypothetical protein [Cyanobacteriota bacterium]
MIQTASRRLSISSLEKQFPGATILDVTSRGTHPWVRFSPFYPHGSIPVPFSPGTTGASVEGIWQALKVFETSDVDGTKLSITNMKGLKRTNRKYGRVMGHRAGLEGTVLLPYLDARQQIYLPCYLWVLQNALADEVEELRRLSENGNVVLLDYETNDDVFDLRRPLSHAGLIKRFMENNWPGA